MNQELADVWTGFRKGRGTRDQIANIHWIIEKAREFLLLKTSSVSLTKASDCGNHNKLWKILKDMGIPDHLTCLLRNLYACQEVTELDVKQQTVSKSGKEHIKDVHCHPVYSTSVLSTSCEMPGWMKHKLKSRLPGEISITSGMQITLPLWEIAKNN